MFLKAIILIIFYYILNKLLIKKNILLDKIEISKHKTKVITNNKTPLSGGLIFIIFLFFSPLVQDKIFVISLLSIYILGLLSDLNFLSSPAKRIFFQLIIILIFVITSGIKIESISIDFFDQLLKINFFNVLFLLLCFLVLINGTNFIDGLNTLVVNYFLICLLIIFVASIHHDLNLDHYLFENIIMLLVIISLFNFFGKSFLGDSGTYSLGFLVGVLSIKFIYDNPQIVSPYFIALILWYPAIENLFSIIRRAFSKKNLSSADNLHLHHLIYLFLKKKVNIKNKIMINSLSGISINIYNFLAIFSSLFYISNSKILVMIILLNTAVYFITYLFLKKLKN